MTYIAKSKNDVLQPASIISIRKSIVGNEQTKQLVVKDHQGYEIIPIDDIIHCQADGNYTSIYTRSGRHVKACKTMKYIYARLPESTFIRIHQSHIVAKSAIRRVDTTQFVLLSNGSQVPYSRREKIGLLVALGIRQKTEDE